MVFASPENAPRDSAKGALLFGRFRARRPPVGGSWSSGSSRVGQGRGVPVTRGGDAAALERLCTCRTAGQAIRTSRRVLLHEASTSRDAAGAGVRAAYHPIRRRNIVDALWIALAGVAGVVSGVLLARAL